MPVPGGVAAGFGEPAGAVGPGAVGSTEADGDMLGEPGATTADGGAERMAGPGVGLPPAASGATDGPADDRPAGADVDGPDPGSGATGPASPSETSTTSTTIAARSTSRSLRTAPI